MIDAPQMTPEPMLFPEDEIPEVATPVSEGSSEWQDATLLRMVEDIRFNPDRLAEYVASVEALAPGCRPQEFLDWYIEQLGGRSQ